MRHIDPAIVEAVAPVGFATNDDVDHLFCDCRGHLVGLCGADLTDSTYDPDMPWDDLCVVCRDLTEQPCPRDFGSAS